MILSFPSKTDPKCLDSWMKTFNYILEMAGYERLTERECEIVATIIEGYWELGEKHPMLFHPFMRRKFQEKLGLSPFNLNNYLKSLVKKGILARNGRELLLNKSVLPQYDENGCISITIALYHAK